MIQGDTVSPTIFNMVVDAIIFHWESLVAGKMVEVNRYDDKAGHSTKGRTIWGRDDGKMRAEEVHAWLKVQA